MDSYRPEWGRMGQRSSRMIRGTRDCSPSCGSWHGRSAGAEQKESLAGALLASGGLRQRSLGGISSPPTQDVDPRQKLSEARVSLENSHKRGLENLGE